MIGVSVDVSEVTKLSKRARGKLNRHARVMLRIAKGAATQERGTHAYTNRTGEAQKKTQASIVVDAPDFKVVRLSIDVPYAKHILANKLSNIDRVAQMAGLVIFRTFMAEAEELGRL